ncbi:transposable element tc3 transposase, partial [Vairimorpha ceranae]
VHKLKRFDFALDKILWTRQWHKVIFSDEKKFNLDGPDGFKYYWHHVNKEEISYSKRIQDGGGIMVWASFCSSEQLILQIVSTKMNSTSYCKMLETPLLPFIEGKSNNINDVDSNLNYIF